VLGVDAAGLLLSDQRGTLQMAAASTERARVVELFQLQSDEGPCLDCFRTSRPVAAPDLREMTDWPRFIAYTLETGYRSVHALPMRLRSETIGALNLFRVDPGAPFRRRSCASPRRWPMWPPSASFRSAPSTAGRSSPSSCRAP
jgi:GAF domain.